MKKLLVLLMAGVMVMSVSVFAFADTTCELSEEDQVKVLSVKNVFLAEKLEAGEIDQEVYDRIQTDLENQEQNNAMRGLGFGIWLRDSEYVDELADIMPHKNMGNGYNDGNHTGERPLNGQGHRGGNRN